MVVHHIQWYCIVLHGIGLYFMAVYSIVTYIQKVKMSADFVQSKKSSNNIRKFSKLNFATKVRQIIEFTKKGQMSSFLDIWLLSGIGCCCMVLNGIAWIYIVLHGIPLYCMHSMVLHGFVCF